MKNRALSKVSKIIFMFIFLSLSLITPISLVSASENIKLKKIADVLAGDGFDILVDEGDDFCYVSLGTSGVKLYDISSYSSPDLIAWKPEENNGYAHQIYKLGSNIYVGDGRAGLTVLNWSTPESPQVQNRSLGYYGWSATSDNAAETLFLASGGDLFGYDTELVIFNISVPGHLELISTVPIPGTCVDVEIVEDLLYITAETIPLMIFDVSNVSDPIELDRTDENSAGSFATDIEVMGNYAYIANWQAPFQIFNIQDPSNITLVYENSDYQDATCVESNENIVYLVDGTEGLVLFNVSNPASPSIIATYDDDQEQYRVDVVDDFIFMTQLSYGFVILKMYTRQIPGYSVGWTIFTLLSISGMIALFIRKRAFK